MGAATSDTRHLLCGVVVETSITTCRPTYELPSTWTWCAPPQLTDVRAVCRMLHMAVDVATNDPLAHASWKPACRLCKHIPGNMLLTLDEGCTATTGGRLCAARHSCKSKRHAAQTTRRTHCWRSYLLNIVGAELRGRPPKTDRSLHDADGHDYDDVALLDLTDARDPWAAPADGAARDRVQRKNAARLLLLCDSNVRPRKRKFVSGFGCPECVRAACALFALLQDFAYTVSMPSVDPEAARPLGGSYYSTQHGTYGDANVQRRRDCSIAGTISGWALASQHRFVYVTLPAAISSPATAWEKIVAWSGGLLGIVAVSRELADRGAVLAGGATAAAFSESDQPNDFDFWLPSRGELQTLATFFETFKTPGVTFGVLPPRLHRASSRVINVSLTLSDALRHSTRSKHGLVVDTFQLISAADVIVYGSQGEHINAQKAVARWSFGMRFDIPAATPSFHFSDSEWRLNPAALSQLATRHVNLLAAHTRLPRELKYQRRGFIVDPDAARWSIAKSHRSNRRRGCNFLEFCLAQDGPTCLYCALADVTVDCGGHATVRTAAGNRAIDGAHLLVRVAKYQAQTRIDDESEPGDWSVVECGLSRTRVLVSSIRATTSSTLLQLNEICVVTVSALQNIDGDDFYGDCTLSAELLHVTRVPQHVGNDTTSPDADSPVARMAWFRDMIAKQE